MQVQIENESIPYMLDTYIKIFLKNMFDYCNEQDSPLNKIFDHKATLLTILTIPDNLKNHGFQRNFWEGGVKGEGIFRYIKPLINRGITRSGTLRIVLNHIYEYRAIENAINMSNIGTSYESSIKYTPDRYQQYHIYNDSDFLEYIQNKINNYDPIACVFEKYEKIIYLLFKEKKKL